MKIANLFPIPLITTFAYFVVYPQLSNAVPELISIPKSVNAPRIIENDPCLAYPLPKAKKPTTEEIQAFRKELEQAINTVSREEQYNRSFFVAWINRESSALPYQRRFELHEYKRRSSEDRLKPCSERLNLSSSHGPLQVMGYNAKTCGILISDLYKPLPALRCGVRLLKSWIKRHPETPERLSNGLANYNGGTYGHKNRNL